MDNLLKPKQSTKRRDLDDIWKQTILKWYALYIVTTLYLDTIIPRHYYTSKKTKPPETTRNYPKLFTIRWNQPKPPKTTRNKAKLPRLGCFGWFRSETSCFGAFSGGSWWFRVGLLVSGYGWFRVVSAFSINVMFCTICYLELLCILNLLCPFVGSYKIFNFTDYFWDYIHTNCIIV